MSNENAKVFFEAGTRHHQAGRLTEAERSYRTVLMMDPEHPFCLHQLGVLLAQLGRPGEALPHLEKSCRLMPNQPAFWNNLGETYRQADRLVEAHQALHKALQLTRKMPEVFYNLGNTLKQLGRHEEAVGAYEAALRLKPDYDRAWYNLGNALREIGRLASAVAAYLKALDLKSEWADAHLNLANAHFDQRELSGAVAEYQRAIQLKPEDPSLEDSLGNALVAQGQIESAAAAYRRANARRPGNWLRQMRCDLLAPPVAPDLAFIDAYRARVTAALDRYADRGQAALPDLHTSGAEPPMLLAYHGRDDRLLMQRFAEFFANRLPTVDPPKRREGKPRIGWVVTHGHEGVFVRCLGELVARLNSDVLESRILCSRSGANVLTHLRQGVAYDYLILPERVDQAAELIRKEEFDLLYYWEIGTDSVNYFLPFFRPTPVQITGWGWPVTSGIAAVDAFISSRLLEPPDGASHYSERLVTLERLPTYYLRPPIPPRPRPRQAFGFMANEHVYLCQQNVRKYQPDFDGVLADILRRDPKGIVAVIADEQPAVTEMLMVRFRRVMPDVIDRVRVIDRLDRDAYLELVAIADVILDTPHYGGGANTILDAVAAGTAMVTWPGPFHRGRWGAAVNRLIRAEVRVATRLSDYADLAVRLASRAETNPGAKAVAGESARDLFSDDLAVREWEAMLLQMVETGRK